MTDSPSVDRAAKEFVAQGFPSNGEGVPAARRAQSCRKVLIPGRMFRLRDEQLPVRPPKGLTDIEVWIDDRERRPWRFRAYRDWVRASTRRLQIGDYCLAFDGCLPQAVVERKGVADFLQCVGHRRVAFARQVRRLCHPGIAHAAIIVEGELSEVLKRSRAAGLTKNAIEGTVASVMARGVPILFAAGEIAAERMCVRFLSHAEKALRKLGAVA